MATNQITTSIVVDFASAVASDGSLALVAELDSEREDNLNNDKTTFTVGDAVHFLVYAGSNVSVNFPVSSVDSVSGTALIKVGDASREVTEEVQFVDTQDARANYPVSSLTSTKWLGNSLGAVSVVNDTTLRAQSSGVAVAKVTYQANFEIYRLSGVPVPLAGEDTFNVLIYVSGDEV